MLWSLTIFETAKVKAFKLLNPPDNRIWQSTVYPSYKNGGTPSSEAWRNQRFPLAKVNNDALVVSGIFILDNDVAGYEITQFVKCEFYRKLIISYDRQVNVESPKAAMGPQVLI